MPALYVAYDSTRTLWLREAPNGSVARIALTAISVMPLLARAANRLLHVSSAIVPGGLLRGDGSRGSHTLQ